MKGNRGMFYSNYQSGAFNEPNMIYQPASGYNINQQYSSFGPNQAMPAPMMNQNYPVSEANYGYTDNYTDEYDTRITKLERQIKNLDARIRKLETNISADDTNINDSNLYML